MKIGSLFSGVGGLELGLERAGVGTVVWQVEASQFCRGILARHWPEARRFENVRTVGARNLEPVSILCGGFPCQDLSAAGRGAGLNGDRSRLWFEYSRIVQELRPRWLVVENIAGAASRWVDRVWSDLERIEYEALPFPIAAQDLGAPHRRERVFILARNLAHASEERREKRRGAGAIRTQCARGECVRNASRLGGVRDRSRELSLHHPWSGSVIVRLPSCGRVAARDIALPLANSGSSGPVDLRVAYGVSRGVDDTGSPPNDAFRRPRIEALGNAVVPQCAEVIGHIIKEMELNGGKDGDQKNGLDASAV